MGTTVNVAGQTQVLDRLRPGKARLPGVLPSNYMKTSSSCSLASTAGASASACAVPYQLALGTAECRPVPSYKYFKVQNGF